MSSHGKSDSKEHAKPTMAIAILIALLIATTFGIAIVAKQDSALAGITSFALVALLILQGMRKIPVKPPYRAVVMIFGRETKWVLGSGWHWLPLYPFWFGFILVKIEPVNLNLKPVKVQTPEDRIEVGVLVELTFTPDDGPNLYQYVKSGGEKSVVDILLGRIGERIRQWIRSPKEGPQTWEEAMDATDDTTAVLLKWICGDEIKTIPSEIPTPLLFHLLFEGEDTLTEEEKRRWMPIWNGYTPEEQDKVKDACKERKALVNEVMGGRAELRIESLGIRLNRLNVTEIKPPENIAETAALKEKERLEREGEAVELDFVEERLKKFMTSPPDGPGLTREQALDLIQTERRKITKTVEYKTHDVGPALGKAIEHALPFFKRGGGS